MKKFIGSLTFIILGFFLVDRGGGEIMWWINQHTRDVAGPKIKYLANDVCEDIVFMGASRCNLHYVPSIISDSIKMSVYNGGVDASDNILAHYISLNLIMSHHTPKIVCLEIMEKDFAQTQDPFRTISFFAPYIGQNEQIDSVFRIANKYHLYKISHLYRYNAKSISNILGLIVNRQAGGDHGYIPPTENPYYPDTLIHVSTPQCIDSRKMEYIQKFINLCYAHGTKVIFTVAPNYRMIDKDYYDTIKAIARKYSIPFMDYHTSGLFIDHPEYFKDPDHLRSDKIARLYSSIFAGDLKRLLNNN